MEPASMNLDIDKMTLEEIKDVLKIIVRLANDEHERVSDLQVRVLDLELERRA